jgi:hypothetical protein
MQSPAQAAPRAPISRLAPLAAAALAAGGIALALLHAWRGLDYWNYSEGVYALTSRLLLHGDDLYGQVVGAQPPGVFLAGAAILRVHDGMEWLRLAVGLVQLWTGLLGAVFVWRITASAWATAVTPAVVLLTPWAVHEHGLLTPEMFGPPLLLGAGLLCVRSRGVPAAGVLAGLAPMFKLSFLLPAAALVALSVAPSRAARWALGTTLAWAASMTAVFGTGLWRDSVEGQLAAGRETAINVAKVWAQAGWNLAPLVVAALLALTQSRLARDRQLLRVLAGLSVGWLATLLTNVKLGTGLNILVPVEATLVPLALAGLVLGLRAAREETGRRRLALPLLGAFLALALAVQTVSLLATPRTARPFLYPTSERGSWDRAMSEREVQAATKTARACPPGVHYSGPPYLAFLARREMAGGQPDGFLPRHSPTFKKELARMTADQPLCP